MSGHNVSYWPIGNLEWHGDQSAEMIIKTSMKNSEMFNFDAPSIRIFHQNSMDLFPGRGPRIGWPIFELDKFTRHELHHLKNVDRLFVCSEWAKLIIHSNGINVPVDVIPLGVDPNIFYKDEQVQRPYWTNDTTVFINIGKWEKRKGHEELLEAFNRAFRPEDNVELWMMNNNPFLNASGGNQKWADKYIGSKMGGKIKILPRVKSQAEMRVLFNQVDFGVFPSHAEGWGLEVLELMACGVPSIATNYSGHTEYLNETNSLLVELNGMEPAKDDIWFHGNGNWCTFDMDELVSKMKEVHEIKQSGKLKHVYEDVLKDTVEQFTWTNSVKKINEVL